MMFETGWGGVGQEGFYQFLNFMVYGKINLNSRSEVVRPWGKSRSGRLIY